MVIQAHRYSDLEATGTGLLSPRDDRQRSAAHSAAGRDHRADRAASAPETGEEPGVQAQDQTATSWLRPRVGLQGSPVGRGPARPRSRSDWGLGRPVPPSTLGEAGGGAGSGRRQGRSAPLARPCELRRDASVARPQGSCEASPLAHAQSFPVAAFPGRRDTPSVLAGGGGRHPPTG